ncbi:MAG: hypothetical protein DRQ42_00220 [Gammaproteobacteria bacterium]|nr:MAG: hypothetical protein DRQ42_00220 [Gammaproteobacteria bacterium]
MIYAVIDGSDLRKVRMAISRTVKEIFRQQNNLPRSCAIEARNLLIGNINKQSFLYQSYSKAYRKWKIKMGYPLIYWRLRGDLANNIRFFRKSAALTSMDPSGRKGGVSWMAGVPGGIYDSGGKNWSGSGAPTQIALYARVNEYGNSKVPARPLFRPTALQYKKAYLPKQGMRSLLRIRGKWR